MAPGFQIIVAETRRFQLDCALYGLDSVRKLRLIDALGSDPTIGRPYAEKTGLWVWSIGDYDLIYAISGDFSKLVLVELRPSSLPQGKLLDRLFVVIDRINAVKKLFGL
ncbi:hypothetical protein [Aurantimonas endophytica]|uniref:Uncharacterized protein n=1 Tax=Aurantimonas endophytica TaxID=1522175 RepID=A0A7W6MNV9_9HYPH|nr:hypothetical protein [Aurantimonas endophytica]MBB4002285.1 hypothetical protein [Aurantimonas endophytica]MCO6402091.1 hypothetical protein [Aurantimonas endophytica]